jgi:hypothetical protein
MTSFRDELKELRNWLAEQKGGVRTYMEVQQRLETMGLDAKHPALTRMLADLAGRFIDVYDGEPLVVGVAETALARLTALVEAAAALPEGDAAQELQLLNEIGRTELSA